MKINQYNQMMSYLSDSLNPALLRSQVATLEQREGFATGGTYKDYVSRGEEYKDLTFEEWLQEDKPGYKPSEFGRVDKAIGGGVIVGKNLGTREGFEKPKKTYTKYKDGKDYNKLKPATIEEQIKIKEEFIKRYNLLKKGKIGVEDLYPRVIAKVVYNLPEVKQTSDFTAKTRQFLKTLDVYNNEIDPQLRSISTGLGKKKPAMIDLKYTSQPGATILRDADLRAEVKKLIEEDNMASRAISNYLQDKYPGQGGLSRTQVKGALRTMVDEGDIDASKIRASGGNKLTGEEIAERTKILKNLILNTNLGVSEISKKVKSPLGGETSRKVILDAASELLSDKELSKRFSSLRTEFMNDVKILDKIVKQPKIQEIINNEKLKKRERFKILAEEFAKKVNKPIGAIIGKFNDRLTALASVYSKTKYYDTPSLDKILSASIEPIKNFNNSNLQKNLVGINSSIKGLTNLDVARMIGISKENIDLLRKTQQASAGAFPEFVLQGDHTDIKSLMANFDNYKDNFMRIQFISRGLNIFKSHKDREILRLFELAKQGEKIDNKTGLPINDALQAVRADFSKKTGGYDIGEFSVDNKTGKITINPKTPMVSNLDAPINQTLKQTAINVSQYSRPGEEGKILKNKFDREYLAAETNQQREDILKKYKNSKILKDSNVLKGISSVSGPIGKAAKAFLIGGTLASPFVITTIATADDDITQMPQESSTQLNLEKEKTDTGIPEEALAAGTVGAVKYGPQLLKLAKNLGSTAARTVSAPVTAGAAGIAELTSEDPSLALAGAQFLYPELAKKTVGQAPKGFITNVLGLQGLAKFGKLGMLAARAPTLMTPVGFALQGAELVNQGLKEQRRIEDMRENNPEAYQEFLADQENILRQSAAYGGRIGFADGPDDPKKRSTMKILGGLASLPLVGRFFDLAQIAVPVAEKTVAAAQNVPPYFLNLISKIKTLGKKIPSSNERRDTFVYKDYDMGVDLETGAIDIRKTKEGDFGGEVGITEEVYMRFTPGMADETTGGKKLADEYEEFTARPDYEGKMKDVEEGVPDDILEDAGMKDFKK